MLGGDWNVTPEELSASKWLDMVNGVLVAPSLPPCNGHVYDYFVVSRCLEEAIVGIQRIEDGGLSPHWPSTLLVRGDARRLKARQLVRAKKVPAILPHSP